MRDEIKRAAAAAAHSLRVTQGENKEKTMNK
jgi:hypothetical protein